MRPQKRPGARLTHMAVLSVRQEERKAGSREGKECLVGLLRGLGNVCECSVVEGMDPAKDGRAK